MHVIFFNGHTYTRAFKVQNLESAKRFNRSGLDFLPERGYVYICYSILKPSNFTYCLALFTHLDLLCVTAPMATCTPHELIITPTCWLTLRLIKLHPFLTTDARALQTIWLPTPPLSDGRNVLFFIYRTLLTCHGTEFKVY